MKVSLRGLLNLLLIRVDDSKYIFKCKNPYKDKKKEVKMGVGEYVGLFSFGIITTGAIALRPMDLPLLIIGAVLMGIFMLRFTNFIYYRINIISWGFLITSFIGGIFASVGLFILLTRTDLWLIINGFSWVMMGVVLVKFNLDEVLGR